jgi:hypothetical protein
MRSTKLVLFLTLFAGAWSYRGLEDHISNQDMTELTKLVIII